jgi:hypothetical protein
MVEIPDIRDRKSLEAWLKDQPREVSVWIASRASARILHLFWKQMVTKGWAKQEQLSLLCNLRSLLISSVAAILPTREIGIRAEAAYESSFLAHIQSPPSTAAAATACASDKVHAVNNAGTTVGAACNAVTDASAVWDALRADAESIDKVGTLTTIQLWPDLHHASGQEVWGKLKKLTQTDNAEDSWQFWIDWYDALLEGRTLLSDPKRSVDMLEQIALIDPETWDAGPETVNPKIREIWEGYKDGSFAAGHAADPEPVSEDAKSAMKQRVAVNRDALVVASAGIIDQLGTFKEQVRGMNHLEPEVREEALAFIDEFSGKLSSLIDGLPVTGTVVDDDQAGRLVLWLREYRGLLRHKLAYYGSAENMAEATVPTGIILGATGVGAMLGMPVAGSVVGGLIVNQMKPGQAAKELTKPQDKDLDPQ